MLRNLMDIANAPKPPTVKTPMPTPDPRGSTFYQRIPQARGIDAATTNTAGEIVPEAMIMSNGYLPSRKQGDAIDFNDNAYQPWYLPPMKDI